MARTLPGTPPRGYLFSRRLQTLTSSLGTSSGGPIRNTSFNQGLLLFYSFNQSFIHSFSRSLSEDSITEGATAIDRGLCSLGASLVVEAGMKSSQQNRRQSCQSTCDGDSYVWP